LPKTRKPTHNPRNADLISLTSPPSLLHITEFLNNLDSLMLPVLFWVCTIFCLFWWRPKAPSNRKPTHNTRNTHQITLTVPPPLLRLTEFLYNIVPLIFPVLCRVFTVLYLLLGWMPRASSNSLVVVENLETNSAPKILYDGSGS